MDPLTALGLASNVVQFIDFGLKVISKARQLGESVDGTLKENSEIEDVTRRFIELLDGFGKRTTPLIVSRALVPVHRQNAGSRRYRWLASALRRNWQSASGS